jgi:hypothetical protein
MPEPIDPALQQAADEIADTLGETEFHARRQIRLIAKPAA